MDFTKTVSIVIPGVLAYPMIHTLMLVSPLTESPIDGVLICIYQGAGHDGLLDQRFDGHLLNVFQHMNDHLTTPLQHPEHRWLRFLQCAAAPFAFQPIPPTCSALHCHSHRMAFVTRHNIDFVALYRFS